MVKAVVFDLDDTLISERDYISSGFNVVSRKIGCRYNLDNREVLKKMNELFNESPKNVFNRVLEFFNIEYSSEEVLELIDIYRNHKPRIKFYDDVIPTINDLKQSGIKLGIITDGYKETQRRKIEVLECEELFDEIIITDELGREFWKPHERAYRLMGERLDVKFDEMVYVGDNEEKDFVGANKLDLYTIQINRENKIYLNNNFEKEYRANKKINKLQQVSVYLLKKSN